jgi:hypothetical protein
VCQRSDFGSNHGKPAPFMATLSLLCYLRVQRLGCLDLWSAGFQRTDI